MRYDTMLNTLKEDMVAAIESLDLHDIESFEAYEAKHQAQRKILKQLFMLRSIQPVSEHISTVKPLQDIVDTVGAEMSEVEDDNISETSIVSDDNIVLGEAPFKRLTKGGVVELTSGESEFIPESLIRKFGINHGDIIKLYASTDGHDNHDFEIIERSGVSAGPTDIIVIHNAIVSYNDVLQSFVVDSYIDDTGEKQRFTVDKDGATLYKISDKDVEKLKLQAGDIIDASRYVGQPLVRARWRYPVLSESSAVTESARQLSYNKDDNNLDGTFDQTKTIMPIFSGNTISMVGALSYVTAYREEVEKRGGILLDFESNHADTVANKVSQSDVVVLPIRSAGHISCELAKEAAKANGIPFVILDGNGRNLFVREVSKALGVSEFSIGEQ